MKILKLTKLFEIWLENNYQNFKYKPIQLSKDKYIFSGINPKISLNILDFQNTVTINYFYGDEDSHDQIDIGWIEILSYEENKGFTDLGWVEPYNNRYYLSYEQLVYENIFDALVEFCNEKFVEGNRYSLVVSDGFTMACICNNFQFEKLKETNKDSQVLQLDLFLRSDIEIIPR